MWMALGVMQGIKGLLAFLMAPLIGALSDEWGRKPFLLLAVAFTCCPLPFLLIHDIYWHMVAVAVSGSFAVTFSVVFA
jgi:MFS family permease